MGTLNTNNPVLQLLVCIRVKKKIFTNKEKNLFLSLEEIFQEIVKQGLLRPIKANIESYKTKGEKGVKIMNCKRTSTNVYIKIYISVFLVT